MRTIFKYYVPIDDVGHTHAIPVGSIVRHVGQQDSCPTMWVEVDTAHELVKRRFRVFGTGHSIPDGFHYVGTTQTPPFVWHVYEQR